MRGKNLRWPWTFALAALATGLVALAAGGWVVGHGAAGRVFDDPARLPADAPDVAVVLGTSSHLADGAAEPALRRAHGRGGALVDVFVFGKS